MQKETEIRQKTLVSVSVVVLLAMVVSFTLAWFAQLLVSKNNQILSGEGSAQVELWAQSTTEFFGKEFSDIDFSTFDNTSSVKPKVSRAYIAPAVNGSSRNMPADTLYLLVDKDAKEISDGGGNTNRLLNEGGLLPAKTVKRRLIVRNNGTNTDLPVSYTINFAVTQKKTGTDSSGNPVYTTASNELAEAVRVDTVKRTKKEGSTGSSVSGFEASPVGKLSGIDGVELCGGSANGKLLQGEYDVYEMTFTILGSASNYYEETDLQIDAKVKVNGGNETYFIHNTKELQELIGPNGIAKDGDTISLMENITTDNFLANRMFNLQLNGYTLTVTNRFAIEIPKVNGRDPFGTIDIGYGDGNGQIVCPSGEMYINAPKAAVRWNKRKAADGKTYLSDRPSEDKLNVRVFNGTAMRSEEIKKDLLTIQVPAGNFLDDSIVNTAGYHFMGTGTEEDPFLVGTPEAYKYLMETVNTQTGTIPDPNAPETSLAVYGNNFKDKFFMMTASFDFSEVTNVQPIGGNLATTFRLEDSIDCEFSGTFNGNYFSLKNLNIRPEASHRDIGVFGKLYEGTVKNLGKEGGLIDASNGGMRCGSIVGNMKDGSKIINCWNTGGVLGQEQSGGIVGASWTSLETELITPNQIIGCYNMGNVFCYSQAGGIIGGVDATDIIGCYNSGIIEAESTSPGGIAGGVYIYYVTPTRILGCYNVGTINLKNTANPSRAGGIVGIYMEKDGKVNLDLQDLFYLDDSVSDGITGVGGKTQVLPDADTGMVKKSAADLKDPAIIDTLNNTETYYKKAPAGTNYPYPWLSWQFKDVGWMEHIGTSAATLDFINDIHADGYARGDGSADNPYIINSFGSYKQLFEDAKIRDKTTGKYYDLVCSLDFTNVTNVYPIGEDPNSGSTFLGVFEGNQNAVYNMTLDLTSRRYVGIFSDIRSGDAVKNLKRIGGITKSDVFYIGGISGSVHFGGTVVNCYNSSEIIGTSYVGGISGELYGGGSIQNCVNEGAISATKENVGGIVGEVTDSDSIQQKSVQGCINYGAVTAQNNVGGIAGSVNNNILLEGCVNTGEVSCMSSFAGGIAGKLASSTIRSCHNTGTVKGINYVGGINGLFHNGRAEYCRNDGAVQLSGAWGGGISGAQQHTSFVLGCYNQGAVSSSATSVSGVGGITGAVLIGSGIDSCYNVGPVTSAISNYISGISGEYRDDETHSVHMSHSYSLTTPYMASSGEAGIDKATVMIKTEAEMKQADFVPLLNAGLDREAFVYNPAGYPKLFWEK